MNEVVYMGKFSILIAEDDADDRFLMQTALDETRSEEKIKFVENGIELLSYLDSLKRKKWGS